MSHSAMQHMLTAADLEFCSASPDSATFVAGLSSRDPSLSRSRGSHVSHSLRH